MSSRQWSPMQKAIFEYVATDLQNHLVVEAGAGCAKTTSAIEAVKYLAPKYSATFLAFNKSIADELSTRLPSGVRSSTYNSFGYSIVRKYVPKVTFNQYKNLDIIENVLPKSRYKYLQYPTSKLVDMLKANLLSAENAVLDDVAFLYGIEIDKEDKGRVYDAVRYTLQKSTEQVNVVDFSDQMYLPVIYGWRSDPTDFVIVDETQDTNACQLEMIMRCILSEDNRVMAIGDRNQSIYSFRGADAGAMDNIITSLHARTLPLSVSYRAPLSVVNLINQMFPHIRFEAAPNAIEGSVSTSNERKFLSEVMPGDMVLCRTNAPMVQHCFSMIREGKKAIIKGRDIGQGLISLIKKMREYDIRELFVKLENYKSKEMDKAYAMEAYNKAAQIEDKVNTIYALADGCNSISELTNRIETVFDETTPGVLFSTVHRAKGLEAKKVWIIEPQLMPHPMAKSENDRQQETNISYVAHTRATEELIIVQK